MKGVMEVYGEILITVLMLVLFFLLLTSIFSAFGGAEPNVVRLNAELLRSKMADACTLGSGKIEKLTIPQAAPYPTKAHWLADVPGVLAKVYTKITGDPKYVIYYETFPIGEAVGWEVYHDFDYRIIAPFDGQQGGDFLSFENKMYKSADSHVNKVLEAANKQGIQTATQVTGTKPVTVIVNNIILTSELNPIPNEEPKPFVPGKVPRSGEWKIKTQDKSGNTIIPRKRDNTFEFSSYDLLTSVEQTTLKYRSCGPNSLCLKTPSGVERLVLPETCNNKPLQYIQLEYDNTQIGTATVAVGGAALVVGACTILTKGACITVPLAWGAKGIGILSKVISLPLIPFLGPAARIVAGGTVLAGGTAVTAYVAGKFISWFIAYKSSDFYLASPCTINDIKIEQVECSQLCRKWVKYPLYEVIVDSRGERRYVAAIEQDGKSRFHYQCIDNIEGVENVNTKGPEGACLRVTVSSSPEGFCWTADPTKRISGFKLSELPDLPTATISKIAHAFGFTPVRDSSLYIQTPSAVVLKPTSESQNLLKTAIEFLEKRYWWSWPGNFG